MLPLTLLAHGSIRLEEKNACCVDAAEIGAARCYDGVEVSIRVLDYPCSSLAGARCLRGIHLCDDHVPAGELERLRVDACKAELEHAPGRISQKLEDPRRRSGGEGGRKPVHRYARYMNSRLTGKFLGVPYDWRRPTVARYKSRWWNTKDRRIVMPRAFGWGYDFNLAEVARRLHLRG
jgi:hypothetical protein